MAIANSFQHLPVNQRVPLFYVEVDPSRAGTAPINERAILFGYNERGKGNTLEVNRLTNPNRAAELYGPSAMLTAMDRVFRQTNPTLEVISIALPELDAGVAATGQINVDTAPNASGTVSLYVDGKRYQIAANGADTVAAVASRIALALNDDNSAPISASATAATVTLTAKWKGISGNDIDIRFNHLGLDGGEFFPTGLGATITPMANGTGVPDFTGVLAALGDEPFDFIAFPWTDTASLNFFQEMMRDSTGGRWAWDRMLYGGGFSCRGGTVAEIGTFGNGRNDPHMSILHRQGSPSSPWAIAASYTARAGGFLMNDPVLPLTTGQLNGIVAPSRKDRYASGEANILLHDGISTFEAGNDDVARLTRAISTYQTAPSGVADTAYLNVQTSFTLARIQRILRHFVETRYQRHGIVDNGTRYGAGLRRVTPDVVRAALIDQYRQMEMQGLVENTDAFKQHLIVERNANDPGRLDVLYTPDLANGLYIFAVLNQFRLQFPEAA